MDLISSLLGFICPFCHKRYVGTSKSCLECAKALPQYAALSPFYFSPNENPCSLSFPFFARFKYRDLIKNIIVHMKKNEVYPHFVIEWLSQELLRKIPKEWKKKPILWVPSNKIIKSHLVEAICFKLWRYGQPIFYKPLLFKNLLSKKQKNLSRFHRLKRKGSSDFKPYFRKNEESEKIILFDDVVSTGTTLTVCAEALKTHFNIETIGAMALAYNSLDKKLVID